MAKAESKPRKVLTAEEQRTLGTGQYAQMRCRDCGTLGCKVPIPHTSPDYDARLPQFRGGE